MANIQIFALLAVMGTMGYVVYKKRMAKTPLIVWAVLERASTTTTENYIFRVMRGYFAEINGALKMVIAKNEYEPPKEMSLYPLKTAFGLKDLLICKISSAGDIIPLKIKDLGKSLNFSPIPYSHRLWHTLTGVRINKEYPTQTALEKYLPWAMILMTMIGLAIFMKAGLSSFNEAALEGGKAIGKAYAEATGQIGGIAPG